MKRKYIKSNGLNISFLDNEKQGDAIVCLHGHYGMGSMFNFVEQIFDGRIILLDQRGHGFSDHAKSYTRKDYVEDLKAVIEGLKLNHPILLGHSLGGVNAYQYASKYNNTKKLIIEDIGTEITQIGDPFLEFPEYFDSIFDINAEFLKNNGPLEPYFAESLSYDGTKWKFRFNYKEIYESQMELKGIYWRDWEKINCPILLLHGKKSWACKTENLQEMARRNKNVQLKIYKNSGHTIHDEEREQFCWDVKKFINKS